MGKYVRKRAEVEAWQMPDNFRPGDLPNWVQTCGDWRISGGRGGVVLGVAGASVAPGDWVVMLPNDGGVDVYCDSEFRDEYEVAA